MTRVLRLATIVLFIYASSLSLAGELTPQQQKMKECNSEAGAKGFTGDAQQKFMSACLSAKATESKGASKQDNMKTCNKDASAKGLKGNERKQFMHACLSSK
jgi:hypothetical protein